MIPLLALFKGFSLKTWGFIALGLAVTALCTKLLFWLDERADAAELREAQIVELNKALSGEREQRREAEVERDTTNAVLAAQQANAEAQIALLQSLEAQQRETTLEINEMKGIFDRHDFTNLANKKPQLILNRVNAGTQRTMDKVEALINEN